MDKIQLLLLSDIADSYTRVYKESKFHIKGTYEYIWKCRNCLHADDVQDGTTANYLYNNVRKNFNLNG